MLAGGEAVWRNRSRRSALIRSALAQPPLRATPVYYQYHGERKMPVRLENNPCPVHILLLASAILLAALGCQQPQPPYSPEAALDTFQLPAGFRIELVAAEPDVIDPVAMAFDEQGRLFVVEMRDYPLHAEPQGRVKLLEDRDGDGRYEHVTVFADGLSLPNGVTAWKDGVLVTTAPDVLYLGDTDGDGRADVKDVVLTGFAATNPQLRVNGLLYGIDNWIYAAYPRVPSPVRYAKEFGDRGRPLSFPAHPGNPPVDVRSRDVRFKPAAGLVEAVSGNSQYGNAFDAWGNRFTVWNNDHLRHVVVGQSYLGRNPYLSNPAAMHSVSDHENAAALFQVTTKPQYIHDSQHGRFTSACGISVYTGGRFPPGYESTSFTCDPVHNVVHRDLLVPDGPTFAARRAHQDAEFLASTDSWFRPVFTATGSDGALYVADYHRPVVEHPEYAPKEIMDHIEYRPAAQCGRIYRVVHEASGPTEPPRLANADSSQLVEHLRHPNLWWRTTAQRLLVDRGDRSVAPALEEMARDKESAIARLHALWTLEGLGEFDAGLDDALLLEALDDPHPALREHAIRLAEARVPEGQLRPRLLKLLDDPVEKVQLQAVLSLGTFSKRSDIEPIERTASRHLDSPWFRTALLASASASAPGWSAMDWFQTFTAKAGFLDQPSDGKTDLLRGLSAVVGARRNDQEIARLLESLARGRGDAWWKETGLRGLAAGVSQGAPPQLPAAQSRLLPLLAGSASTTRDVSLQVALALNPVDSPQLRKLLREASSRAHDATLDTAERAVAIRLMGLDPTGGTADSIEAFLSPRQSEQLQAPAVESYVRTRGAEAADPLIEGWRTFTGRVRETAVNALWSHKEAVSKLLGAIESGQVQPWSLSRGRQRQLLRHSDPQIRARADALFSDSLVSDRHAVYEKYRPALRLDADADAGRNVFRQVCAECHKVGDMGDEVGPDLLSVVIRNKEVLMTDILMPNESIEAGYEEYLVETTDGRQISGVIAVETPDSVTLRRAKGEQDVVPRKSIAELRSLSVSPMPEDLENEIDLQAMADLLAYLKSL